MKKILSFILLVAMCFSVILVGCNTKPKYIPQEETDDDELNFYGSTFTILTAWPEEFNDKQGTSTTNDRMLKRYQELKDNYGVNIAFSLSGYSNADVIMLQYQISGRSCAELIDCTARNGYSMYKASMIVPLSEVSAIDLTSDKWGTPIFRIYGKFDGQDYGFYSYWWENIPQVSGMLFTNTALIETMNLTDPHEYIESGDWTWANFRTLLSQATYVDGDINYKGLISGDYVDLLKSAIFSNGNAFITEKDGIYTCNLESSEATAALDYVYSLVSEGYVDDFSAIDGFSINQTSPFYFGESHYGTIYTTSSTAVNNPTLLLEKFGMVQFPYGPNGNQDIVSSFVHGSRRLFFVSNVTNWETDEIGSVTKLLFEPLPDSDASGWKFIAESYVFHYEEDFNNYVSMLDNVRYDYSAQMDGELEAKYESILSSAFKGDTSMTEAVQTALPLIYEALGQNG